jgi:hypothetical protein
MKNPLRVSLDGTPNGAHPRAGYLRRPGEAHTRAQSDFGLDPEALVDAPARLARALALTGGDGPACCAVLVAVHPTVPAVPGRAPRKLRVVFEQLLDLRGKRLMHSPVAPLVDTAESGHRARPVRSPRDQTRRSMSSRPRTLQFPLPSTPGGSVFAGHASQA